MPRASVCVSRAWVHRRARGLAHLPFTDSAYQFHVLSIRGSRLQARLDMRTAYFFVRRGRAPFLRAFARK
eukprot:scaffold179162_cov30-Tisochrysis_lutea.AAC.1